MWNRHRKLRNLLLFPGAQFRHGFFFVGVTTFFHLLLTVASIVLVDAWLAGRKGVGALPFWQIIVIIAVLYVGFLTFVFLFGLFISHKWLGPMYAIEKYASKLKAREYQHRLLLRQNALPQFQELASALNILAERLESTDGKSSESK
jgi:hypothetical protein